MFEQLWTEPNDASKWASRASRELTPVAWTAEVLGLRGVLGLRATLGASPVDHRLSEDSSRPDWIGRGLRIRTGDGVVGFGDGFWCSEGGVPWLGFCDFVCVCGYEFLLEDVGNGV